MQITEENIKLIEEYASALFSKREVLAMMSVEASQIENYLVCRDFVLAYDKGRFTREFRVRKSLLDLAENGSAQAQIEAIKLITKLAVENV
jgi:hypothetical protein